MLNESDAQTEEGHAMVKFDTFPFFPELEPRSAWMYQDYQQMRASIKAYVYVSEEPTREVVS